MGKMDDEKKAGTQRGNSRKGGTGLDQIDYLRGGGA